MTLRSFCRQAAFIQNPSCIPYPHPHQERSLQRPQCHGHRHQGETKEAYSRRKREMFQRRMLSPMLTKRAYGHFLPHLHKSPPLIPTRSSACPPPKKVAVVKTTASIEELDEDKEQVIGQLSTPKENYNQDFQKGEPLRCRNSP